MQSLGTISPIVESEYLFGISILFKKSAFTPLPHFDEVIGLKGWVNID